MYIYIYISIRSLVCVCGWCVCVCVCVFVCVCVSCFPQFMDHSFPYAFSLNHRKGISTEVFASAARNPPKQ